MLDRDKLDTLAAWYTQDYGEPITAETLITESDGSTLARLWAEYTCVHCPRCGEHLPDPTAPGVVRINAEDAHAHQACLVEGLPLPATDPDAKPWCWLVACPADDGLPAYYGFGAQAVQLVPGQNPRYTCMILAAPANHADWMSKRLQSGMRGGWPVYLTREAAAAVAAQMAALR